MVKCFVSTGLSVGGRWCKRQPQTVDVSAALEQLSSTRAFYHLRCCSGSLLVRCIDDDLPAHTSHPTSKMSLDEHSSGALRDPLLPPTTSSTERTNGSHGGGVRQRPPAATTTTTVDGGLQHHHDLLLEEGRLLVAPPTLPRQRSSTRLLDRSGTFRQSKGRWGVERLSRFDDVRSSAAVVTTRNHPTSSSAAAANNHCFCCCCGKVFRRLRYCCPFCCSPTSSSTSSGNGSRGGSRRSIWACCTSSIRRCAHAWGKDWFFFLAYQKTCVLFLLLFTAYSLIVCFFGFVYLALSIIGSKSEINPDGSTKTIAFCDMDINDHMEAMYFSLSTMTTIGYGVSDYYFGGCYSPLLIVLWQVCTAIVFDAVAVGLIFHRISRGAKRSRTILFSDMAVVRRVRGIPYLMFRLGERRKYHLIEATVRCYCIRHTRLPVPLENVVTANDSGVNQATSSGKNGSHQADISYEGNLPPMRIETTHFVSRSMRLLHPDDRFGSHVWMGLPQMVVHRLDDKSPLVPSKPCWFDSQGISHPYPRSQPQSGGSTGGDEASYQTSREHDLLAAAAAISSGSSVRTDATDENGGHFRRYSHSHDLDSIHAFLNDRDAELVVLVEGTDEGTGAAIQARHSYKTCDIAWNHSFSECIFPYSRRQRRGPSDMDPVVSIDFSRFHNIQPAPLDCDACAYVPV